MGRKKTPFPPWQTCKSNGIEERYIRLGNSQMLHEAMKQLSGNAFKIYTYMLLESGGNAIFEFPRCKYKSMLTNQTFQKVKMELVDKGFIEVVQNNANLRKPNKYRFIDEWKRI